MTDYEIDAVTSEAAHENTFIEHLDAEAWRMVKDATGIGATLDGPDTRLSTIGYSALLAPTRDALAEIAIAVLTRLEEP